MMQRWFTPADASLAIERGRGKGVRIAVLDSGIEACHPALDGLRLADDLVVVEEGGALKLRQSDGVDLFGHGTAIAGVIRQMAPEAEIGSIRVLGEALSARTAMIMAGARAAIERGYHVLNCSFGCGVPEHVLHYKTWVDQAYLSGVHVVAGCNNQDTTRPEWPGFFTSVLAVNMVRTEHGNDFFYRPGHLVEFAASGVDVELPWCEGSRKRVTGSSFAVPRITSVLACLLSELPELTPLEAKLLLQRTARPWTPAVAAATGR